MDNDGPQRDAETDALNRVLASAEFARSERLSSFLRYVCGVTFEGSNVRLTEQHIGVEVFGRPDNYTPGEDTIVRTNAAMLRKRLTKYYEDEGRTDPMRIAIPRGSYIPVFVAHGEQAAPADPASALAPAASTGSPDPSAAPAVPSPRTQSLLDRIRARRITTRLFGVLGIGCLILLACLATMLEPASAQDDPVDAFWRTLLNAEHDTLLVPADSELVMFQAATGREISLDDYIAKRFDLSEASAPGEAQFGWRRYTGVISVTLAMELGKLSSSAPQRLRVRYARDLQLGDLKQSNAILVGIPSANPWVHLFRNRLNYHIDIDRTTGQLVVRNDRPAAGEEAQYAFSDKDASRDGYAVLAYTPNLSGKGKVLMVGGTSSAGTEAAVDFLLNRDHLRDVLAKAKNADGSIGQFEILLHCALQASGSTDVRVLGIRVRPG